LIKKFVGKSAVDLPYVDLRSNVLGGGSQWWSYFYYASELLPFIYIQLLMLIGFIGFCAYIVVAVYVPEYNSYAEGCVHNTKNETFISAKLFSLAFNYAASDGNSQLTKGMQAYNTQSSNYCVENQGNSANVYNNYLQAVSNTNQSFQSDVSSMSVLSACVDTAAIGFMFQAACCSSYATAGYFQDLSLRTRCEATGSSSSGQLKCPLDTGGQPYKPPGDYMNDTTCSNQAFQVKLEDAVSYKRKSTFDCTALPVCEISCGGMYTYIHTFIYLYTYIYIYMYTYTYMYIMYL
jgi:hypothetical protein